MKAYKKYTEIICNVTLININLFCQCFFMCAKISRYFYTFMCKHEDHNYFHFKTVINLSKTRVYWNNMLEYLNLEMAVINRSILCAIIISTRGNGALFSEFIIITFVCSAIHKPKIAKSYLCTIKMHVKL